MTGINTLAVTGLLLAMMLSPSLSYPHSEEYVDEDRMETMRSEGEMMQQFSPRMDGVGQNDAVDHFVEYVDEERTETMRPEGQKEQQHFQQQPGMGGFQQNEHFATAEGGCAQTLHVMAFTSGSSSAGSNDSPSISIHLINGAARNQRLPDLPGDDMAKNKGDLWSLPIYNFHFGRCITKNAISHVIIEAEGNDGWKIRSIMTVLEYDGYNNYDILSVDFNVNRWIDRDDDPNHKRFPLNIVRM